MAESKNTFIKSKMNRDLDARLLPNGEYREAINVSVSQSEGSDVGTLQTVLGNIIETDLNIEDCNVEILGYFVDEQGKNIYLFLTNFIDTSTDRLSSYPPDEAICNIWKYNTENEEKVKLVEGKFLNFSLTHYIENINLLEDLLFWTDNRNQPRKININKANPGRLPNPSYYTNDDQINVAKYYPFEPISLLRDYIVDYSISNPGGIGDSSYNNYLNEVVPTAGGSGTGLTVKITSAVSIGPTIGQLTGIEIFNQGFGYEDGDVIEIAPRIGEAEITITVESQTTMKDTCTEFLPVYNSFPAAVTGTLTKGVAFSVSAGENTNLDLNDIDWTGALAKLTSSDGTPYLCKVQSTSGTSGGDITLTWPNGSATDTVANVSIIELGLNPDYNAFWPGDCQYLKDKFVRFAYRFKFDDNEYSLISPFTQACFIPQQDGYFLSKEHKNPDGSSQDILDTVKAYEDTDVEFFQNKVTDIELLIPCPSFLNNTENFSSLNSEMHIESIEIIYKDDNENVLKVLDTISLDKFESLDASVLSYSYQSRRPSRTLPESEITRVSDRVPIKALTQEITGNRVVYGNYVDGYTSVRTLNYEVAANQKRDIDDDAVRKEYQNHTLKQNRNYQVGVVLVDRYGRTSDVILSSLDSEISTSTVTFSGSTIYHGFKTLGFSENDIISLSNDSWPGDALQVKFNSQIPETTGQVGYPGLFTSLEANPVSDLFPGGGYANATNVATTTTGIGTGLTVDIVNCNCGAGYLTEVTINNSGTGYAIGDVITITGGTTSATFVYNPLIKPNLTGWYSYKIVVKQTEQDYYNVYLPGIVNGTINKDGADSSIEATVSLFSDNINKVPKDLREVGPSQTNYNSNVNLSLRVSNVENPDWSSVQFYPGTDIEKVTQISELSDLGVSLNRIQAEVVAPLGVGVGPYNLSTFNENVYPGMSVTSVDSGGVPEITSTDGVYIKTYYANGSGANVLFNTPATVNLGDTFTFGPPGVVYNASNNPLIGILSTSTGIGVSEQHGFTPYLSVAETQPFESLLDIYYETTSSGLVNELNNAVASGLPATFPVRISPFNFNLTEAETGVNTVSSTVTLIDNANNSITSPNVTGSLISVLDGQQNNRTSEFTLADDGNGGFSVQTKSNWASYVGQDSSLTTFDFTLALSDGNTTINQTYLGESITNVRPTYTGFYDSPTQSFVISRFQRRIFPKNSMDPNLNGFQCINGSGDVILQGEEIQWELISAICTDGENAPIPDPQPGVGGQTVTQWPVGYITSGVPESWQIKKFADYKNSLFSIVPNEFSLQASYNGNNTIISRTCMIDSAGLRFYADAEVDEVTGENLFGQAQIESYTIGVNTAQLVNFVTFELILQAVDRSGSGLAPASPTITIELRLE